MIDPERASNRWAPARDGDTTYLCTVDGNGMGVSLIQSNAAGFGSGLVEPSTGINLHNRGLGFNLDEGHPAEFVPGTGRRTRCARRWPRPTARCASVFGTMGGDAQPQILLQLAARLFHYGQSPAAAVSRTALGAAGPGDRVRHVDQRRGPDGDRRRPRARRSGWPGSPDAATRSRPALPYDSGFGHAHAIVVDTTASGPAPPTRGRWCGTARRHLEREAARAAVRFDHARRLQLLLHRTDARRRRSVDRTHGPPVRQRRRHRVLQEPARRGPRPPTSSASTRCGSPSTTSSTRATRCCPTSSSSVSTWRC